MFATVPSIATRLTAALGAGWSVTTGNQSADRRALPRADVRLGGAGVRSARLTVTSVWR